ncbi:S1C family serine protease [Bifidobacterium dentium]|uniref:Serine protease n=1 Tax=Bifidobacterium dentium (strain ATCC 27534 / DSM 20436 / JCM 1195 / Bd1) TaxID=401473 RepID=D2Q703_BIFDB|nr:trypsin-like peptidase domain-containing protein [Bifidobacterium dentium]ADB08749.1 Serine protease [Bifidobacterium dentium Bd1]EDT44954.1 trypsin [Bifidobacterium dentium ATCC 27678]SEC06759.1 putative serine protease PepD [Bifidobacterium dentium JCM 1195 = DSM 20436]VEG22720.1 serine protease [Bifidobacterium dentium]BAQ26046.1 putative protease [Bifidobacterium dentium JCM 1195 = DSM 20436]
MAEDNNDQNVVQPQNNAQQAVPTQPADAATDNAETSVTEPIAVHDAGEQPTTTLPSVNAADSEIAPDYASAAGESTVVSGGSSTGGQSTAGASAQSQYRPAPEYGAYGTVPPQPTNGTNAAQPQYGQPAHSAQTSQMPPQNNRNPFFGNPYVNPQNEQHDSRGSNPFTAPQGGANVPPNTPNNGNPFNPFGNAGNPQNPVVKTRPKTAGNVVVAVVAALVAAVLCLGVGYAAITNGWVHVPTSSSMTSISSNQSGSGSAKAKSGEAVDWTAVAKEVSNSVVSIQTVTSEGTAKGSGAIVSDKGYIVTNNHVISGAQQIQVTLANGTIYSAQVVGTDTTTDLAVIKLDNPPSDLKAVEFADSDDLAVGEAVMAIGNPLGYDDTATTGIVSALNRPVTVTDDNNNAIVTNAVQIDAAINPGNSGGPTFNAAGQVIGINSSIASTASSSSSAGSIGIGFAIPSNLVKRVANEIIENGSVQHVALGITIKSSTVEADGVTRGCAQVQSVVDGGPASKAGVKAGDSIVAFNGKAVNNNYSLLGYVRASAMNDKVTLTIVRDGHTMDLEVTLNQEESSSSSSNKQEQNEQNNGGNGQDQQGNGQNGDGGGFTDPFGLW